MTEQARAVRRILVVDENDRSKVVADGPTPDVRVDPARPGFSSARVWVTDRTPISLKAARNPLDLPHTLEPPAGGSVCRVVTFPPDASFRGKVGAAEVQAYFTVDGRRRAHRAILRRRRILTCRKPGRSISAWCSEGEITLCSTPRRSIYGPATPWCSAAPVMRGATAPTGRAWWPFPRMTRHCECA